LKFDGESHNSVEARVKDEKRQQILKNMGLRFLRFDDWDVKNKMELVLMRIKEFILELEYSNPPTPPFNKGGHDE